MKLFKPKEPRLNLMVCYETSEAADNALSLALKYAPKWHAAVDVVFAVQRDGTVDAAQESEMEKQFRSQVQARFGSLDVPYATHMLAQPFAVGEQLVMFSEKKPYEFIFIGISKRSKVGKLLYGSTAQYLILNAPCPVVSTNGLDRVFHAF